MKIIHVVKENKMNINKAAPSYFYLPLLSLLILIIFSFAPGEVFAFSVNYIDNDSGGAGGLNVDISAAAEAKARAVRAADFFDSFAKHAASSYTKQAPGQAELKSRGRIDANGKFRYDVRGDVLNFYTRNLASSQYEQITADCVRTGKNCYIYKARGVEVAESYLDRLVKEFDENIYPVNTANFGFEWKPGIDNDNHITLLLLDIKDGMEHTNAYVAGYFFAGDEFSRAQVPHSNEREMMYLDVVQGGFNDEQNFKRFCRTISHEFQHAIHWHHDDKEMTWLNEMLSEYSAFINNYGHPGQINAFFKMPDTSLIAWRGDRGLQNYGAIYMFGYYLVRTVVAVYSKNDPGALQKFTKALVANKQRGIASVISTLSQLGINKNFKDIYLDWLTANAINNQAVSKRFGYDKYMTARLPVKRNVHGALPVSSVSGTLDAYGGLYAVFSVDPQYLKDANNGAAVAISGVAQGGYAFKIAVERTDDMGGNQLIGRLLKIKIDGSYSGDDFIIGPDNNYTFTVPAFPLEYKTLVFIFGIISSETLAEKRPTYKFNYCFVPISSSARYMVSAYKRLKSETGVSAEALNAAYEALSSDIIASLKTQKGAAEFDEMLKTLPEGEKIDVMNVIKEVKTRPAYKKLQDAEYK